MMSQTFQVAVSIYFWRAIALMIFLVPASSILAPMLTLPLFLLLSIAGVFCRFGPTSLPCRMPALAAAMLIFGVATIAVNYYHGVNWGTYHVPLTAILTLPFVWLLQHQKVQIKFAYWGGVFGALSATYVALKTGMTGGRAGGHLNPIIFAGLALILSVVTLAAERYRPTRLPEKVWLFFIILSAFGGLLACLLSGSKAAIVAIPFIVYLALPALRRLYLSAPEMFFVFVLAGTAVAFYWGFLTSGPDRLLNAVYRLVQITMGDKGLVHDGSIAPRLEFWVLGIELIKESPILGTGRTGLVEFIKNAAQTGQLNPAYGWVQTLHSEFLDVWAVNGLIGLLATVSIYGALLYQGFDSKLVRLSSVTLLCFGLFWVMISMGLGEVAIPLKHFRTLFFFYAMLSIGELVRFKVNSHHLN